MKKMLLLLSLSFNLLCILFIYFNCSTDIKNSLKPKEGNSESKKIFVISPAIHASLEQIEEGIVESLTKELPNSSVNIMNANGKKTLMLAQIQEALSSKPDAIISIGAQATQLTHEFIKKRNSSVLHVFTAVTNPESMGISYHPKKLTGIEEKSDYQLTTKITHHIAPHIRSILLVYNPGEGNSLEKERSALEGLLNKQGITLTAVEVFHSNEINQKTKNFIAGHDAVAVLKDNTVVAGLDSIVKLCEQHKKPLITHNLDSAEKGAALSFGADEKNYGTTAGKIAAQALIKKLETLPEIQQLTRNKVKINLSAAAKQNLPLDPVEVTLLQSVLVI